MMIDPLPLVLLTRISTEIFKFRFGLDMVKDDWPTQYCQPESCLKCFKLRFSLDMVKDDSPPSIAD